MSEEEIDIGPEPSLEPAPSGGGLGGFLLGIVLGAVVGAGVALLTSPRQGRVVRRKIKRRLEEFGDDAREKADDWREEATRRLRRRKLKRRRFRTRD